MKRTSNVQRRRVPEQVLESAPSHAAYAVQGGAPACDDPTIHFAAVHEARRRMPADSYVDSMCALFSLLANDTRLRLLLALLPRDVGDVPELCVCDLASISGASVSMTSHQLRMLRAARLVEFRRDGKLALYRLTRGSRTSLLTVALDSLR